MVRNIILVLCNSTTTGITITINRAAAFDITGHKTSAVIFRFVCNNARQESSKFYGDLRNASSLELAKYHCINCHCSADLHTVGDPLEM